MLRVRGLFAATLLVILNLSLGACGNSSNGGNAVAPAPAPAPAVANASFTAPASAAVGAPVVFDASASTSSDGSSLQYFWNFGDGAQGGGRQIARVFATSGAHDVTLTVIDGANLSAHRTRTVTVAAPPAAAGSASVEGAIATVTGVALDGVTVTVVGAAATGTTDAIGNVHLTLDLGVPVTLKLTKTGYVDQFVSLQLPETAGTDAYFTAAMRVRDAALSLTDAAAGGTLTGRDGAVITLPANALVDATGSPVIGAVDIALTPVDVTQANADGFPGRFDGLAPNGTITPIESYGTVEYVLSIGAQRLHLALGKSATIEIPLYGTLNADGSAVAEGDTKPLWSLDESTGIWVQEGVGTVVASTGSPTGLAVRASVTHFSWWNSDIGFDPYGPEPKCVYDTNIGIPGANDTFATATICNMLAEFDRPQPAPQISAGSQASALTALSPRVVGYSRRAVLPIAGGVPIPVPANVNISLSATALNGSWTGHRVINGPVGVRAEEQIPMRPIAGTGPGVEQITVPLDTTRALQDGQTALFGFTGAAFSYAHITISDGPSSLMTGRMRLLQGASVLGTANFQANPVQITALMPTNGPYTIEVTGLANVPGVYRLQVEFLGGRQTEALTLPFSVNTNVPQYFTYHGQFTSVPETLFLAYAPLGSGAVPARVVAPDGSVLANLNPPTYPATQTATTTLPVAGTYALDAASATGAAFNVRATAEQTYWVEEAPPLPIDSAFGLIDLLADQNGKPVVGYWTHVDNTTTALRLRRWTGAAWETVGSDLTIDNPCNSGAGDLAIGFTFDSANAPVVAYGNSPPSGTGAYVTARRFVNGAWQSIGANNGKLPGVSAFIGTCYGIPALAFNASGALHVVYRVDNNVVVQRFDGSQWTDATTSGNDSFPGQNDTFDLRADANGRIYFVLASPDAGSTVVRRLTTATPPAWEFVGANNGALPEISTIGLANGIPPRLRFDAAGSPLIAFVAGVATSGGAARGVAVYRYDGPQWSTTGGYEASTNGYISNGNDLGFTLFNGDAYVSWVTTINFSTLAPVVQTNSAAGWTPVGADLGQIPQLWTHGLATNSAYSMRLLATGGQLYHASVMHTTAGNAIQLLRKVD